MRIGIFLAETSPRGSTLAQVVEKARWAEAHDERAHAEHVVPRLEAAARGGRRRA